MQKEEIQKILENLLSTGGDFGEVFIEDVESKTFQYIDHKLEDIQINSREGIGLRLADESQVYYGATNHFDEKSISKIIEQLKSNINKEKIYSKIQLKPLKKYEKDLDQGYTDEKVKNRLKDLDLQIRNKDSRINQVSIILQMKTQKVTIANHTGLYVKEDRLYSRIFIKAGFQDEEKVANVHYKKGLTTNFSLLDTINFDEVITHLVEVGIDKLYAKPCIGKVMPVILSNQGGVLFHEACGHAMEATSVADGLSVLSNDLNQKIATTKVTIIDDGTLANEWGSTEIDDEGHKTQKNILIQNGILKSYLIDEINSRKMKQKPTGSARRESYLYAPTSRMNNTYLDVGTDSFEDMIKDIKLGFYAEELNGGCVSPETGDFNFGVDVGYMIRDGKIAECVKSASLIGNTKEILNEVEMVGSDLALWDGMCGSLSGYVPVNTGQPIVKIGHILVGGEADEK